jgi:hypothetical protein
MTCTIKAVLTLDRPDIKITPAGGEEMSCDCPVCAKRGENGVGKFYFKGNIAFCHHEGRSYKPIELHSVLKDISYSAAKAELEEKCGVNFSSPVLVDAIEEKKITPLWVRNFIYRRLINKLSLSEFHQNALLGRGLVKKDIAKFRFRDVPQQDVCCDDALKELYADERSHLFGIQKDQKIDIAGFYYKDGHFYARGYKTTGILIPIIVKEPLYHCATYDDGKQFDIDDCQNLISGFQIRHDNGRQRYSFYAKNGEFTGYENIHCIVPDCKDGKAPVVDTVFLTEGCLKADVACSLMNDNQAFVAVMGVNSQKWLEPTLYMLYNIYHCRNVVLCFDQDKLDNKNVMKALGKAEATAEKLHLEVKPYELDDEWKSSYLQFGVKGIDDFLLFWEKGFIN